MRWLVDVVTLGKTDTETLYVDAGSWQKALQAARAQRGEAAPMSGFSIELLDDGCRAVDPLSRLRYEVRRAPEPPATVSTAPAAELAPTSPQPPASSGTDASANPEGHGTPRLARPDSRPTWAATPPPPSAQVPPPTAPATTSPSTASIPPGPPPSTPRADLPANVPSQVIFKREHDANDSVRLTYREYVFLVPVGTSEEAAEALLHAQLEMVLASLARMPAGKLVNLGVFDVAFRGKPPVAPLATLMWKDWRGAPVVEFPRTRGYVAKTSAPPPALTAVLASALTPVDPLSTPPLAGSASIATAAAAVARVVPQSAAVALPAPPTPAVAAASAPAAAPAPARGRPAPEGTAAVFAAEPSLAVKSDPAPSARTRARGEDLITDLFDSMHELHFLRDAVEGGNFCLALAMEKIPSQAGIVHLYDINRREFLVTSTRGVAASTLLLRRHTEADVLLSAAMRKRRAVVIADASASSDSDAASLDRYVALGGARSLMVAPVMQAGRFLGAIELLNPLDGQPYTEAEGNALMYIADQFAEFVASRGVVTDPERISSRVG